MREIRIASENSGPDASSSMTANLQNLRMGDAQIGVGGRGIPSSFYSTQALYILSYKNSQLMVTI